MKSHFAQPENGASYARHLGLILVAPQVLLSVLAGKGRHYYEVVENALPEDTVLVGCQVDRDRDAILLKLEHPRFPLVAPGERIPELESPLMQVYLGDQA